MITWDTDVCAPCCPGQNHEIAQRHYIDDVEKPEPEGGGEVMAASYLSKPGTEYGPCKSPCEHRDCAAFRIIAETGCARCRKPIGYETRFYDKPLVHALCEEIAIEQENRAAERQRLGAP